MRKRQGVRAIVRPRTETLGAAFQAGDSNPSLGVAPEEHKVQRRCGTGQRLVGRHAFLAIAMLRSASSITCSPIGTTFMTSEEMGGMGGGCSARDAPSALPGCTWSKEETCLALLETCALLCFALCAHRRGHLAEALLGRASAPHTLSSLSQ